MSEGAIHPPPRFNSTRFSEFEEMEVALRTADVRLCQSGPGKFEAGLATAKFDEANLCVGWEKVGHLTRAASQSGFLVALDAEGEFRCSGHPLHDGDMLLCHPGGEHMAHSTGGVQWAYFTLPPERLERDLAARAGIRPVSRYGGCAPVRLTPNSRQCLRTQLHRVLSVLDSTPRLLDNPDARRGMEQSLREAFYQAMADSQPRGASANPRHVHACIVSRAQEYLRENLHEPVYMQDVGTAAGVSERTLRNAFQAIFGLSPNRYLKVFRMNAVRRELRAAGRTTVVKVAERFGFWDMSRFAVEYRALFGESPSATRRSQGPS